MNPLELMLEVIRDNTPPSIWTGSTLGPFRQVANTNRGDIGEEFIFRYLSQSGIAVSKGTSRISVTHKLTRRPDDMRKIEELPEWIRSVTKPAEAG